MIKYRTGLKYPLLSSTSFKQQSNILRTEMGSGRARQRQLYDSVPTMMAATWRLSRNQANIFEDFIEEVGMTWFLMKVLTPRGLVEHQVRFIKSPLENFKPLGSGKWQYQSDIEIKKYTSSTQEQAVNSALKPNTLTDFVNGVENALDKYQE
ncbi:MAG TPA: hypothetical protein DCS78_12445 [Pseudoalteromonas shioyasakiensis]|nr:hypothetical protein [Pseudoalteromonas shioyasakiensis]